MMYRARMAYRDNIIVSEYDSKRFYSLKGKTTDFLEKSAIEKALKYVELPSGSRILDLPCGTGRISTYLAKKGYKITGGDISPAMVDLARLNTRKTGMNSSTEFHVLDAEKIDCANKEFDMVVSLRFFGHTPPDVRIKVLNEFKRIGKKYFILAYYIKNSFQEIVRRKRRLARDIPWFPVSSDDIEREMRQVGIRVIKAFPVLRYFSETVIILGESL